jgi:hypothetical protein
MVIEKIGFQLTKPLLFMVFNRPDKTRIVFEEIKKAQPKKLYISCDGPRRSFFDDVKKVNEVREILSDENITWECEVKRLYHDENLGVSMAGYKAFHWVFSYEEDMIELEDDCVPVKSFFIFCQELLDKYKYDERICYITANNNSGTKSGNESYFFSRYGGSWGWATWKRVWDQWDYLMSDWPKVRWSKKFQNNFRNHEEYNYWRLRFQHNYELLQSGKSKSYDIQSLYYLFKNNKFNIYPNFNLVRNIGWDDQASNTFEENSKFAGTPAVELNQIIHPKKIIGDPEADEQIFKYHFYTAPEKKYALEKYLIKKILKRFLFWDKFLRPIFRKK